MNKFKVFILGIKEFKNDFTTNFDHYETQNGDGLQECYDLGRETAHRLTMRHFDQTMPSKVSDFIAAAVIVAALTLCALAYFDILTK